MKNQALVVIAALALTLSVGYADQGAPVASAPVTKDDSYAKLASELGALDAQDRDGRTDLTISSDDTDASAPDLTEPNIAKLYVKAVKAQRAERLRELQLAWLGQHKTGYLVAANAAFEAAHPAADSIEQKPAVSGDIASALAYDPTSNRDPLFNDASFTNAGNDTLVSTPEPGSTALFLAGGLVLAFFIRKRATTTKTVPVKVKVKE